MLYTEGYRLVAASLVETVFTFFSTAVTSTASAITTPLAAVMMLSKSILDLPLYHERRQHNRVWDAVTHLLEVEHHVPTLVLFEACEGRVITDVRSVPTMHQRIFLLSTLVNELLPRWLSVATFLTNTSSSLPLDTVIRV